MGAQIQGLSSITRNRTLRRIAGRLADRAQGFATNAKSSKSFGYGEAQLLARIPKRSCIVDIGANRGEWGDLALRFHHDAEYLAVEPDRGLKEALENLLPAHASILSGVMVGPNSLSSFVLGEQLVGGKYLNSVADPNQEFQVMALDEIVKKHLKSQPDFVKVDTDGFDWDVIESGKFVFSTYRPMLQVELGRFWAIASVSHTELFRWAKDLDYLLFLVLPKGISRVTSPFEVANIRSSFNIFGCPRELYK